MMPCRSILCSLVSRRWRPGFTLLEVIVSTSVISVILLGMSSAMLIAGKAVTQTTSDVSGTATAQVAQTIVGELRTALTCTEMTATAIAFTVPDRNGDSVPETIRYAWSGITGAPLTRQYNGGTAVTILDSVQSLSLGFNKSATPITVSTESAEQTLWTYTASPTPGTFTISSSAWVGEMVTPTLPANATSWKVTRVQYQARKNGSAVGQTDVQLRTVSGGLPTSTIVDHVALAESGLISSYQWTQSSFTNAGGLTPGSTMCIAFQWISDTNPADLQYQTLSSALSGGTYVSTANGGSTWTTAALKGLNLVVYGTTTAPANSTQYNLQTVDVSLRAGSGTSAASPTIMTSAPILNQPQVTGP